MQRCAPIRRLHHAHLCKQLHARKCGTMPPKKRSNQSGTGSTAVEPSKMKMGDLRDELERLGLETAGKKADLVSRLEDSLKSQGKGGLQQEY